MIAVPNHDLAGGELSSCPHRTSVLGAYRAACIRQVAAAPSTGIMMKYDGIHDDHDFDLHDQFKAREKDLRRSLDNLEAERFAYHDDPCDRNRQKVKEAQLRVNEATEEGNETWDRIAESEDQFADLEC